MTRNLWMRWKEEGRREWTAWPEKAGKDKSSSRGQEGEFVLASEGLPHQLADQRPRPREPSVLKLPPPPQLALQGSSQDACLDHRALPCEGVGGRRCSGHQQVPTWSLSLRTHLVPACGAEVGSWRGPGEDVSRNYSHYLSKISTERWMQIREKHVQVQRKKNCQGNETCRLYSQDILKSEIHLNYKKISIYWVLAMYHTLR